MCLYTWDTHAESYFLYLNDLMYPVYYKLSVWLQAKLFIDQNGP